MTEHRITAGFLPLTDSLILVVAKEMGFAAAEGIGLTLVRELSWANIRDRIAVGQFDVAHMLAPMPIAASLGLNPIAGAMIAPFALGYGGNAVTVSTALWAAMRAAGVPRDFDARGVGAALARVVQRGGRRFRLGVVHPHSSHNYELRYWLAGSGIHPDRDVEIVILPPPLMADALNVGGIDGYCVGEPWNSVAVASGAGHIATVKAAIWPWSPEKVLGSSARWAERNRDALAALIRALRKAASWCGDRSNHAEAAQLLSQPEFLGQPAELIGRALSGEIEVEPGVVVPVADFFVPEARGATVPNPTHALWFYSQMVRWGDVAHTQANAAAAAAAYRPDLYRNALGVAPESAAEMRFFDEKPFPRDGLDGYVASQIMPTT